jgi:AmmeMemoRadiSam system protein A
MEMDETLEMKCGAFVTLNENGRLRGCIGHFGEDAPLFRVVAQMAREAAFDDGRFEKVEKWEMPLITIEISALSPLRKIDDIGQFRYGRQGIYMRKGGRGGTFLPQVAAETGWTEEEFLGHCARDKAEIGWDGWKTAELYTYEAIIFKEGE